jgi:hypothetical protein
MLPPFQCMAHCLRQAAPRGETAEHGASIHPSLTPATPT